MKIAIVSASDAIRKGLDPRFYVLNAPEINPWKPEDVERLLTEINAAVREEIETEKKRREPTQ